MEEERRLFYVAITRAKDQLYLITEKGNASRFLKEIPDEYKETQTAESHGKKDTFSICKNAKSR
jgi:DNA helicase-4